jgi:hypothetical protein
MNRLLLWAGVVLLVWSPVRAEDKPAKTAKGKLVKETWDAVYLEGAKTGLMHTVVEEIERDGKKVLATTMELSLTVRRYNEAITMRMRNGSEEAADGKVLGVSFTQFFDGGQFTLSGKVDGDKLIISLPDGKTESAPWNEKALGLYGQERIYAARKAKPEDKIDYISYELALKAPLTMRSVVKGLEEVDLLEEKKEGDAVKAVRVMKKLLRVEAAPDKIEIEGRPLPLPRQVVWLDKDLLPVRIETDMPGLGKLTAYRTTRALAEEKGAAPALLPDFGLNNLITLNKPIDKPLESKTAVFRLTVTGDDEPSGAFARDIRQEARNVKGDSFEMIVKSQAGPVKTAKPEKAKEEYLKSCFFLDSDDATVKGLAAKAVGDEADAWSRAKRVERWVHENMTPDGGVEFVPASKTARDLRGDCRQHAMLTAAMCRAAGVPARTALGLVYVRDAKRGPILGFHMWTEVNVEDQWVGLDATLGRGGVGVGHLKINDASWAGLQSLAPTLPVNRVLGKLRVELLKVEE